MTTAGSATTPQVSCGPSVPPRFGRPSMPPATYLWLVFAFLNEWGPPAAAITWIAVTWIAVTWIAVTWQRIQTAGGVVRTTLRISGTLADLAGHAAAEAEKVLVNARRALHRAVDNLTQLPVTSTTTAFRGTVKRRTGVPVAQITTTNRHRWGPRPDPTRRRSPDPDRTPHPGPQPGQNRRPGLKNRETKINNSAERRRSPTADTLAADRQEQVASRPARTVRSRFPAAARPPINYQM